MDRLLLAVYLAAYLAVHLAQEQQLLTALEGNSLALSCPSRVSLWFFEQFRQNVTIVVSYDAERRRYVCADEQWHVCMNAASFGDIGSPLVLLQGALINAGVYACIFFPPYQLKVWNVAVVSKHRTSLSFDVDGDAFTSSLRMPRDVHDGSRVSMTCVVSYAGFHDPGLELVLVDAYGNRRVLATSPSSINSTFSPSAVSQVSAVYRVQTTDCGFHIRCLIADDARSAIASQLFQRQAPCILINHGPNSPHLEAISTAAIVLMVIVVLLVTTLSACFMKSRNSQPLACLRRSESDECHVELTPSSRDIVHDSAVALSDLPPSYSEMLQAEASAGRGLDSAPPLHAPVGPL